MPALRPAARHRLLSRLGAPLRFCWRSLRAACLLMLALLLVAWLVLHWVILPRANDWRPWLEQEASRALGLQMRIGSLAVDSRGWLPKLELSDTRLLDPAGREALRLPRVAAVLSAQSLLVLEPRFSQLLIDTPELEVRRDRAGRIFVAGLDVQGGERAEASGAADAWMDWLFSQPELALMHGRVRWVDERRPQPSPLELEDVNLVLRNGLRSHELRLDATPPAHWGQRFSLRGQFNQKLLKRPGALAHWRGQLYADLPRADLHELRRHVDLPFELSEGDGALRAWLDIEAGEAVGGTLDVALRTVRLRLSPDAPELNLEHIEGRLALARSPGQFSLQAHQLGFVSADGVVWPRSDWGVKLQLAPGATPQNPQVTGGEVNAQRLDFALMAQIAERLPLGADSHRLLTELAPQGVLAELRGQWAGPLASPSSYRVRARLDGLALAAKPDESDPLRAGRPGLRGASLNIDANERGGQAELTVRDGQIELPGLWQEPVLPITHLHTQLSWKLPATPAGGADKGVAAGEFELRLADLRLQTPDTRGELDLSWRRAAGTSGPGYLDLSGKLDGLDAQRVARYMPQALVNTRSYLSRALLAGRAQGIQVRLKGDLADFPFDGPRASGIFRISTQAQGVQLAYVPPAADGSGTPWPSLEQIDAELVFDRAGMAIRNGRARVLGYELLGVNGGIKDLHVKRVLDIEGSGRGGITDLLRFVRTSPLDDWLGHGLSSAVASGPAALKLALQIPLDDSHGAAVKGQLVLGGVELRLRPDVPQLGNARARIDFDQHNVQVSAGSARLLGGDVQIDGGTQRDGSLRFGVQGVASAEALRRATELGPAARLAQFATGQAPYRFQLALSGGQAEISLASSLQGMALDLPAPLRKDADAALPLRLLQVPTGSGHDELRLELGTPASPLTHVQAQLQRDTSGASPRVLRGAIAVQDKLPALPASGLVVQASVPSLDLDAWRERLHRLMAEPATSASSTSTAPGTPAVAADADDLGWLPQQIGLRSASLRLDGRVLTQLTAELTRNADASLWRIQVEAAQLAGTIELRGVQGEQIGQVQARLSRLSLPRTEADAVSEQAASVLDAADDQPVPALDIVVDDFELRGKRLGRLEVQAQVGLAGAGAGASAREWRLDRLQIKSPDATLDAHGAWSGAGPRGARRTMLDWKLDVADAGRLLERLGQGRKESPVLRGGKGVLAGQIGWAGSPIALHYPSMAGKFSVALESGTFLKAEPGVGRLLGVLSLQSLPRRLLLDFRDVFDDGFTFDGVSGNVTIEGGVARSDNIRIRGLQATVLVDGRADLALETQNLRVLVVPEVSTGGASLAYAAINPAIALGTFLAQLILSRPVAAANTREFHITGTWDDPKVEHVSRVEAAAEPSRAGSAATAPR